MEAIAAVILVGAVLLLVSILTSLVSFRVGAPLLLVFLLIGLLAGEQGLGIQFDDAPSAFLIGSVALAVILFDSGFNTKWASYRIAAAPSLVLATVGVLLTAGLLATAARWLFGLGWPEALLIGAILGSSGPAAVFFLLRVGGITLRDRVRSTLEIESGANDPVAIFLTLTLATMIGQGEAATAADMAQAFAMQIGLGAVLGVVGGRLLVVTLNRLRLETGLYPILSIAGALVLFALTGAIGGSGFLAVYIAGLVAGNARLRAAQSLRRFQDGLAWLAQIVMFVMLGLLANPSEFPAVLLPALALALVLVLGARPIAVWACLLPFRFSRNETSFVAWVGLRGAVSILLAIVPFLERVPGASDFFNVAFLVVLISLLLQGWTIRPLARYLGLIVPPRIGPIDRTELDLPGTGDLELVAYRIHPQSPVARGQRLPRWARPPLIVRDGRAQNIHGVRQLRAGDLVYLFASPQKVPLLDRLFAGTHELEEDDTAFWGDMGLSADATVQAVAEMYGLPLDLTLADQKLAALFLREFGEHVDFGDRLRLGPIELVARAVEDGRVTEVGLALEPSPASSRRIPVFQSPREIRAGVGRFLRDLTRRARIARRAVLRRGG
ncbi:MAG: potassium/proton antiporter [Alphaproteobacteria bacterium]